MAFSERNNSLKASVAWRFTCCILFKFVRVSKINTNICYIHDDIQDLIFVQNMFVIHYKDQTHPSQTYHCYQLNKCTTYPCILNFNRYSMMNGTSTKHYKSIVHFSEMCKYTFFLRISSNFISLSLY